jgi:hypothetical protein
MSVHPAVLIAIVLIAIVVSVLLFSWIVRWLKRIFRPRARASLA